MEVPLMDLAPQHEALRRELVEAFEEVVGKRGFASGPAVERFEGAFATYCRTAHCVGVNSGTSALHLAMRCLEIGPGDEVITVSLSFVATAWPILYLEATPVFVDADPERYTMDPEKLETVITERTKAIVPVHLYGQCADMDPILEVARARGIPVIEDAAQAHGAEYKGQRAGSMGRMGCFSFYPSKNLGACGEGGALVTADGDLAARARLLRDQGQRRKYVHDELGYNYRMDGIQGAILSVKLRHLEEWTAARERIARHYDRHLAECCVTLPRAFPEERHVYHLYVVRDSERDDLKARLAERGVASGVYYPVPIHLQKPFLRFGYGEDDLPVTEEVTATCLSLPMYPELSHAQVERVVEAVRALRGPDSSQRH